MITIAIDGPSGSGKGTVSKYIAEKLGIIHLDTGALYRVIGYYILENKIDPKDENAVNNVIDKINIDIKYNKGEQNTFLNGNDVSKYLRSPEVTDTCSITSTYLKVRAFILELQRNLAKNNDLIIEGRDITSHVLPNAKNRFFLTAPLKTRAKRRFIDMQKAGENKTLEEIESDLLERDRRDTFRKICPMILVKGVVYIDNDGQTAEETAELILRIVNQDK